MPEEEVQQLIILFAFEIVVYVVLV